jgi:hypothetical protein
MVLPDLILMMRLYWPMDEAVNGAWALAKPRFRWLRST